MVSSHFPFGFVVNSTRVGRDFVAVAAEGHRTPAASLRSGVVIKKDSAFGIGALLQLLGRALGN